MSDYTPDNQLKIIVKGTPWIAWVNSRFVADDSLSILQMHRVCTATTISSPVISSLQNKCTVLGVELKTTKTSIDCAITDFDLANLSLWLVNLNAAPVVFWSLSATICSIPERELVLIISVYFVDCDKIVVVIELFDGWEVHVMLALPWHVWLWVSPAEFVGRLVL